MRTRHATLLLGPILLVAAACSENVLEPAAAPIQHAADHARGGGGSKSGGAYRVVTLGTLGGSGSQAWAINDGAVVVGSARNAVGQQRGFVWTESEGMRDLLANAYDSPNQAVDVSEAGRITGLFNIGEGLGGFVFDLVTQQVAWLPALPDHNRTQPWDINTDGLVVGRSVGTSASGETDWQTVVWIPAADGSYGQPIDLGCPTMQIYPAINAAGSVVANDCPGTWWSLPRMWARSGDGYGSPITLGTLGGRTTATAIDDRGRIAGRSTTTSGETRAVIWQPGDYAAPIDLGDAQQVLAMNNRNEIVGERTVKNRGTAAVWTVDDAGNLITVHDLPAPDGYRETVASGISDGGWIVGWARNNTSSVAVLWRPSAP